MNGGDGDAFAWDAEGFFHVGSMDRLDQVVTRPQLLLFERLDVDGLDRLNAWGQHYFLPDIVDPVAGTRLANAIHAAIEPIRAVTADAVALCAQGSRTGVEYDIAALCRTALAGLKAADWRAELGRAIGDPLDRGQAVAAVFDGDDLVLTRDNAVLAVMASGLQVKGALSYPELTAPRRVLENVRLSGR